MSVSSISLELYIPGECYDATTLLFFPFELEPMTKASSPILIIHQGFQFEEFKVTYELLQRTVVALSYMVSAAEKHVLVTWLYSTSQRTQFCVLSITHTEIKLIISAS